METFVGAVVENVECVDSSWTLLLVAKDEIDPFVKMI